MNHPTAPPAETGAQNPAIAIIDGLRDVPEGVRVGVDVHGLTGAQIGEAVAHTGLTSLEYYPADRANGLQSFQTYEVRPAPHVKVVMFAYATSGKVAA